jgi:hypothetical protein
MESAVDILPFGTREIPGQRHNPIPGNDIRLAGLSLQNGLLFLFFLLIYR